jgi:cell division protein FtsQ
MADTYSDTNVVSILDRRKQLKQQRRSQFLQSFWRTFAIVSGVIGIGWCFNRPEWKIRQANQVQIMGNEQLSAQAIEAFLPLSFPTSLLRIKPAALRTALEQHTHVDKVWVNRQLFPPHVIIKVQERPPVALTPCPSCVLIAEGLDSQPIVLGPADLWLLDAQGIPLPSGSYPKLQASSKVPKLSITGFLKPLASSKMKQLQSKLPKDLSNFVVVDPTTQIQWKAMYEILLSSPIKVQELNWEDPKNLQLKTEFGMINLGAFSSKFSEQLQALDQMRALPERLNLQKIKSIDLVDPKHPVIKLNQPTQTPKPQISP